MHSCVIGTDAIHECMHHMDELRAMHGQSTDCPIVFGFNRSPLNRIKQSKKTPSKGPQMKSSLGSDVTRAAHRVCRFASLDRALGREPPMEV